MNAPLNFINLHVRGGYIIPTQEPANNTFYSRQNPIGLVVALNDNLEADGELFYDDGDSLDTISGSKYFLVRNQMSIKMILMFMLKMISMVGLYLRYLENQLALEY